MLGHPLRIVGLVGAMSVSAVLVGAVAYGTTRPKAPGVESASAGAATSQDLTAPSESAAPPAAASPTPSTQASAAAPAATPAPAAQAAPAHKPVVVAIGDSIMDGHGLTVDESYPALLAQSEGWTLDDLASDGTGYVTVGVDDNTFQSQADQAIALKPDIVIVAGSSNDLGQDDAAIGQAESTLLSTIATRLPNAQIIGLNTFWGDGSVPDQISTIDAQIKADVTTNGGTYLDIGQPLAGRADLMQSDDVHPTAEGQQRLANAVAAQLPAAVAALAGGH